MTLLQALNVTRIYQNVDMEKYKVEGGLNLSLFVFELSDLQKILLQTALKDLYPDNIQDAKGNITINTLTQAFNIFQNQLISYLNSTASQYVAVPTDNKRMDAIIADASKSDLKQGISTDYETLIDTVISCKASGFALNEINHIQDMQFVPIRKARGAYIQEIAKLESDGKLGDAQIKLYNETAHTLTNLKGLLNYFKNSKV